MLRLGSTKDAEDKHGALPLQYAQQGQHSKCCQILVDHDPNNPLATQIPQRKGKGHCILIVILTVFLLEQILEVCEN